MQIQIFKKQKQIEKKNFKINVNFYWKLILLTFFILTISSFIFGFYLFKKINKDFVYFYDNLSDKIEVVKKERIEKGLEYFSNREKKSIDILNSPSPIIDPSR